MITVLRVLGVRDCDKRAVIPLFALESVVNI